MNILPRSLLLASSLSLAACSMTSPYWGQTFDTTATAIPIQTWSPTANAAVRIDCSKAYHGGLYPPFDGSWSFVTNISPTSSASYDPQGGVIYSAGKKMTLPADCWHADNAYNPPKYMTALRATQTGANGSVSTFRVFDQAGLACLGHEIGQSRSWSGWVNANCALTYSNSTTPIPYVRILASQQVAAAMARSRDDSLTIEDNAPSADEMGAAFAREARDPDWAPAMEKRLQAAYFEAAAKGSELAQVSCRLTMCQAIVHHADEAAGVEFAIAMAPSALFTGDGIQGRRYASKDGRAVTYYLAREANELPRRQGR